MSTIVYQGLQSCFEPQPTETKPLRLILAAPKDTKHVLGDNNVINTTTQNTEKSYSGGWSFLQSLSNSTHTSPNKPLDCDGFYPSPKLSQRSLEICTENLGSETGSDDSIDINIFNFEPRSAKTTTRRKQGHVLSSKKANPRSFPPPLTTMSGPNSIQVRPHREGGRLIIKAVEAPSTSTCFEAERSHGRLQLRFVENCKFFYDYNMNSPEDYEDDSIGESETKNDDVINFEENGANNNIVDEIEKNICYMKNDMDGNKKDAEVEIEREKIQRHNSRCKESGHGNIKKGLCNWEAFWVAT